MKKILLCALLLATSLAFPQTTTKGGSGGATSFSQLTGSASCAQLPALTGDATTSAGSCATALAAVNSNVGSYTNANITVNAKGLITAAANGSSGAVSISQAGYFGDGSNGNVTCTGASTLASDMFYNNLTVQSGCAINTGGYRIFVAGTLDISAAPAGSFYMNGTAGNNGGTGTSGGQGTGGAATASLTSHSCSGAAASGAGGAGGAVGTSGGNGNSQGGPVLAGGTGGAGVFGAGYAGGTATVGTYFPGVYPTIPLCNSEPVASITVLFAGQSGPGGGGGAGIVTSNEDAGGGGGGGGGAGGIAISANIIARGTNSTAGIFQAIGGAGGPGGGAYASAVGAGGGGGGSGGGGGWALFSFGSETGSVIVNAVDVSGGAGGNAGNGVGTGGAGGIGGGSGGSGRVQMYNMGAGTLTSTAPVAGAAGSSNSGLTGGAGASKNTMQVNL